MKIEAMSWKKLSGILRGVGAGEVILQAAKAELAGNPPAPRIPRKVVAKLRATVSEHGKAVVTFGRSGTYRVYSPDGHEQIANNGMKRHVSDKEQAAV